MKKTLITAAGALLIAPFPAVLISSAPVHAIPSPPLCPVGQMPTGGSPLVGGGGGCMPNPNYRPQTGMTPQEIRQCCIDNTCNTGGIDPANGKTIVCEPSILAKEGQEGW